MGYSETLEQILNMENEVESLTLENKHLKERTELK